MATTPEQEQAAYDTFVSGVKHPVFFRKLAAAGFMPRSTEEAQKLIYIGDCCYADYQAQQAQEAEKQGSLVDLAFADLEGAGISMGARADSYFKQAADTFVADPEIQAAGAVLVDLF